eukprot:CAMPEP_0114996870 /NCGR_PEP_ID=MMETSP0216-20121206/14572_1 /TAXON_ID=223996 /ORGANISM="Protocruzia adherens, Strain Boccale" /LENGTH=547 /DNA_ID=CAMNT_0002361165 /DNA_START=60 /DNA_END=1700 /DNA_ORIENTATION=-
MEISYDQYLGKRVEAKGDFGTVRYYGPKKNDQGQAEGEQMWVGVEWDSSERGKHQGTIDGVEYFKCLNEGSGSLVKAEKVDFGIDIVTAIREKYQPNIQEALQEIERMEREELYFETVQKKEKKHVEFVGKQEVLENQSNLDKLFDVCLQESKISSLTSTEIEVGKLLPRLRTMYLDLNLIATWDEVIKMLEQALNIKTLTLTGNRLRTLTGPVLPLDVASNPFQNLRTLVLIGMKIDWTQVEFIAPFLGNLTELLLCKNLCSKLTDLKSVQSHGADSPIFGSLKTLNLEENNIESWDEVLKLGHLAGLERLIVNNNHFTTINFPSNHFVGLSYFSIEENQIADWSMFNEVHKQGKIEQMRFMKNPLIEQHGVNISRQMAMARVKNIAMINGSVARNQERIDAERNYIRRCFEEYQQAKKPSDPKPRDEAELEYLLPQNPRYVELLEKHGHPLEQGNLTDSTLGEGQTIKSTMVQIKLRSMARVSVHKDPVTKKLPHSMTVGTLKTLCAKFFSLDINKQKLVYHPDRDSFPEEMDDNLRQLSFYGVR